MAVGDDAVDAGWPLVPESGEEGRVRWGAREINRTRDMAAEVKALIPTNTAGWQAKSAIRYGTVLPGSGSPGDIFIRLRDL